MDFDRPRNEASSFPPLSPPLQETYTAFSSTTQPRDASQERTPIAASSSNAPQNRHLSERPPTQISNSDENNPESSSRERLLSESPASIKQEHPRAVYRSPSAGRKLDQALPPLPRTNDNHSQALHRVRTLDTMRGRTGSGIDWIVPMDEKNGPRPRTVAERLQPTLETARTEKDRFARKARNTGYALNIAIGLQVLLGSLTTGLSALGASGTQTAIPTTILGGITTLVASYLARQRGSNEPELSITRVKDLEKFIREIEAYILDNGFRSGGEYDHVIDAFRGRFEGILGNGESDSTERKLSPPA